jgi:molybdopterin converting factor small subunit
VEDEPMQVRIKLMAALRNKLPAGSTAGGVQLDLQPGTSVAAVLERLGIQSGHIHLVTVNGEMEPDRNRLLQEGDEVCVFPPVAGGEGVRW